MQIHAHNNPVYLIPQFAITGTYAGAGSAELAGTPLTSLGSLNSAEDGNMLRRTAPCLLPEHDQVDLKCPSLQSCLLLAAVHGQYQHSTTAGVVCLRRHANFALIRPHPLAIYSFLNDVYKERVYS